MDDGRTDGRRTDGRTTEHGYTISSPCEPDGSGELKRNLTQLRDELIELNKHGKYITFLNYKDVL